MSLIEQAARRLEELRRAGAEVSEERAGDAGGHVPPTPEAFVRAMNVDAAVRPHVAAPAAPLARATPRTGNVPYVDIDLRRLRQLGFITPDEAPIAGVGWQPVQGAWAAFMETQPTAA